MQIIGDPIGAVKVKLLTSQTHTYKVKNIFARDENLGDKRWLLIYLSL